MSAGIDRNFSRKFVKYLHDFGITIEPGGTGHAKLMKRGVVVATISTTGTRDHTERAAVRSLVKRNALPRGSLRVKFS